MTFASVTSKGQLVIPVEIRRRYGIKPGTRVCFIERDGDIIFQPITKKYIRSVAGMLKSDRSATQDLLKESAKDKKREETKIGKIGAR